CILVATHARQLLRDRQVGLGEAGKKADHFLRDLQGAVFIFPGLKSLDQKKIKLGVLRRGTNGSPQHGHGLFRPSAKVGGAQQPQDAWISGPDRKSTCLNSSHVEISYAVFCLKKKKKKNKQRKKQKSHK